MNLFQFTANASSDGQSTAGSLIFALSELLPLVATAVLAFIIKNYRESKLMLTDCDAVINDNKYHEPTLNWYKLCKLFVLLQAMERKQ